MPARTRSQPTNWLLWQLLKIEEEEEVDLNLGVAGIIISSAWAALEELLRRQLSNTTWHRLLLLLSGIDAYDYWTGLVLGRRPNPKPIRQTSKSSSIEFFLLPCT